MTRCRSPWVLLCIDDQSQALEIRKRLLERAGYRVLTTTSAHQALELFRANDVDLVLAEHIASSSIDGPTLAAASCSSPMSRSRSIRQTSNLRRRTCALPMRSSPS